MIFGTLWLARLVTKMSAKSFSDLLKLHARLDELFLEHQRALIRLDTSSAFALLETYETELLAHMRDEEERMIPLYSARAEPPVGGAPEIFVNEHEKMRQYVRLFKEGILKLEAAEDLERGVIWLLDSHPFLLLVEVGPALPVDRN